MVMLPALRPDLFAPAEVHAAPTPLASGGAGFRAVMDAFMGAAPHGDVADLLTDEDAGTPQEGAVQAATNTIERSGAADHVDSAGMVSDVAATPAGDTGTAQPLIQSKTEIGDPSVVEPAAAEPNTFEPGAPVGPARLDDKSRQDALVAGDTDPRAALPGTGASAPGPQATVALPPDHREQTNTEPGARQAERAAQTQPLTAPPLSASPVTAPLQALARLPVSGAADGAVAASGALGAGTASPAGAALAYPTPERSAQGTANNAGPPVAMPNSPLGAQGARPAIGDAVTVPRAAEIKRPAGSEALLQGRLNLANPPAAFSVPTDPATIVAQPTQPLPGMPGTVQTAGKGQSFALSDAQTALPGLPASGPWAKPGATATTTRPAAQAVAMGLESAVTPRVGKGTIPPAAGIPATPPIDLSRNAQAGPQDDTAAWPREVALPAIVPGPSTSLPGTESVQRSDLGILSVSAPSGADAARPAPFLTTAGPPAGFETAQAISRQILDRLPPAGGPRFEIALAPAELGNVTLRLIGTDAGSLLVVQADRPETVDLMRRHIGMLEAELRSLGHDALTVRFGGHGSGSTGWGPGTGTQGQAWGAPPDRQQVPDSGPGLPGGANDSSAGTALPPPSRIRSDQLDLRL
jgi:hypothetical protein